jgi:hypothetical protein
MRAKFNIDIMYKCATPVKRSIDLQPGSKKIFTYSIHVHPFSVIDSAVATTAIIIN